MRFFAYRATDSSGRSTEGTIQAATADDARRLLTGGGLRVLGLNEIQGRAPAPPPPASRAVPRPAPASLSTPAPTVPVSATLAAPALPVIQPAVQTATVPTSAANLPQGFPERNAGEKTSFFFYEALGRYLRSGVAANRALEELGQRARKPWLGERFLWASKAVAAGMSLADALDRCACFPTGSVGTIRAGEMSGAVPDACFQAANGCERAHKLRIKCAFMCFFFVLAAVYFPIGQGLVSGSLDTISDQWEHDGGLPAGTTAARHMLPLIGHNLLVALPFYAIALALWRLWLTPRMRLARHRAILRTPVLAGRAREESLARTSWALTELSRAGLSPARALAIAGDAAPNLEIARRFREQAGHMREQDRLSTAIRQTGLMEPQLVDVVENGELAGDVPGAIASVYRTTDAEFQRKDGSAHTKIWAMLYPIAGIIVAAILYHLYKSYYMGLFERIQ